VPFAATPPPHTQIAHRRPGLPLGIATDEEARCKFMPPAFAVGSREDRKNLGAPLGHDVSHSSAHAPEMKPEQKQEQAVTPQREIAPQQEQAEDFGLGL